MFNPKTTYRFYLVILIIGLGLASLACSADDLVGQRQIGPTPTIPAFATATPGGRISVWLITPDGQVQNSAAVTATSFGNIVAPAATATAAYATLQAATAAARVTFSAPVFQPNDCPTPGNPLPSIRPANFGQFAQAIALYLSAGGPTTTLESTLRTWGAIVEGHGVLQADTDLTGDGVNEIIVTLYDPSTYKPNAPSPGQLLIYGCAQKGYRLLYSTPFSQSTMLPELKRVGNMNGDGRAQIAFTQQLCTNGVCTQSMQILNWNAVIGSFVPLNDVLMDATNAKVTISDLDNDGILEVSITSNPPTDLAAGPYRRTVRIWDWNGVNYVLALVQQDAPIYRVHMAYDADATFLQGDFRAALKLYDKVRDDQNLQAWTNPNDYAILRAYATYRKMVTYAALKQSRAVEDTFNTLQSENPPGSPADVWTQFGSTFLDTYKTTRSLKKTCVAALNFISTRSDLLASINSYGSLNHTFVPQELCPF